MGELSLVLAIAAVVGLGAVLAVLWRTQRTLGALKGELERRSQGGELLLVQQQLDALRGQLDQRLDRSSSAVGEVMQGLRGELTQRLQGVTDQVTRHLQTIGSQVTETQKSVGDRLETAARSVAEVRESLGKLEEANRQILDVGRDLSRLHEILGPPKLRGGLGEYFLADLLKQVLPAARYRLQHRFTSGAQVDALVMLKEGWVAVDAKFPLENFRRLLDADGDERRRDARRALLRDVKSHVDDIARKYIQPQEGTLEFAVMYIPAENVYYEIMLRDGTPGEDPPLLTYALEKRVFPVSPTSFYAYLLSILVGLRGLQVEQRAREIQQRLGQLRGDLQRFDTDFDVLGKHLRNAAQKYEDAGRRLEHLRMRLQGADQEAAPELEAAPEREPLLFPTTEERA